MSFPHLTRLVGSQTEAELRQLHVSRFRWLVSRATAGPVLELGSADGPATLQLADRGLDVTAVEPDDTAADLLRRRLSVRPREAASRVTVVPAPLDSPPPGPWATVLVTSAGERVRDLQALLTQVAAVLQPDGHLVLSLRLGLDDSGLPWAVAGG
jgi:SAM-dependent methyltransferase